MSRKQYRINNKGVDDRMMRILVDTVRKRHRNIHIVKDIEDIYYLTFCGRTWLFEHDREKQETPFYDLRKVYNRIITTWDKFKHELYICDICRKGFKKLIKEE